MNLSTIQNIEKKKVVPAGHYEKTTSHQMQKSKQNKLVFTKSKYIIQ